MSSYRAPRSQTLRWQPFGPGNTSITSASLSRFRLPLGAIDHFLASLSFGGGAISQVNIHLFVETMPFGGVGYSGIGH